MKLLVKTCQVFKVGGDAPEDAYYVEAFLNDGRTAYHKGPEKAAFFTEKEANDLANNVFMHGIINSEHWMSSRGKQL